MSAKGYFDKQKGLTSLRSSTKGDASKVVEDLESREHIKEYAEDKNYFYPDIDYSNPEEYVVYGSAKKYYENAFKRIRTQYPYDGSLTEKQRFINSLTPFERYVYTDIYPRENGYVIFVAGDNYDYDADAEDNLLFGKVSTDEYIRFYGGPNKDNIISSGTNQENNLEFNPGQGTTIEFWLKKDAYVSKDYTEYESIFNLRNDQDTQRFWLFLQTKPTEDLGRIAFYQENWNSAGAMETVASGVLDTKLSTIADSQWHHYAIAISQSGMAQSTYKLYVDSRCTDTVTYSASVGYPVLEITGNLYGTIAGGGGANPGTSPDTSVLTSDAGRGKLSASMDEFRFWKTARTSKQIGMNYFRPIGGGTNSDQYKYYYSSSADNSPVDLGVYFKFNEGLTLTSSRDQTIIDYAGRNSNGIFIGYTTGSRSTASAFIDSGVVEYEEPEPVLSEYNVRYTSSLGRLQTSGSNFDVSNNTYMFNMLPQWIREDDERNSGEIQNLLQVVASYFDTLQAQVSQITKLKEASYISGSNRPINLSTKLLNSVGFETPEIFIENQVFEEVLAQDEKGVFKDKLYNLKNKIYKNIYNNLVAINKAKGTEKAFRNTFRCFGVDDELFRINLYGDNVEHEIKDNFFVASTQKNLIDFSGYAHEQNREAVIFQFFSGSDEPNPEKFGYMPTASNVNIPMTMEAEILFPKKPDLPSLAAFPHIATSSLFGVVGASLSHNNTRIPSNTTDGFLDLQVLAIKNSSLSTHFLVTSSNGFFPALQSVTFSNEDERVYDDRRWNLAVRVYPEPYPFANEVTSAHNFKFEFYGAKVHLGETIVEFSSSTTIDKEKGGTFLTGSNKRFYIGAKKENVTGSLQLKSDVRFSRFMVWNDYISDDEVLSHARDPHNYGRTYPYQNAFLFEGGAAAALPMSGTYVPKIDTLALNWEFNNITTASSLGIVHNVLDSSSGSQKESTKYSNSNYGLYTKRYYMGEGRHFSASAPAKVMDFLPTTRNQRPETLYSENLIEILTRDEAIFKRTTRPVRHFFAVEASMYEVISREMLNFFASITSFNNLIGEYTNKYRDKYKDMEGLRRLFFEKIEKVENLDKFISLYKWLDNAMDSILTNLIPASADAADQARTIVENHVLSRNKYRHKYGLIIDIDEGGFQSVETPYGKKIQDPKKESDSPGSYDDDNVDPSKLVPPLRTEITREEVGIGDSSTFDDIHNNDRNSIGISNPTRTSGVPTDNKAGRYAVEASNKNLIRQNSDRAADIINAVDDNLERDVANSSRINILSLSEKDRDVDVNFTRVQLDLNNKYGYARNKTVPYQFGSSFNTTLEAGTNHAEQRLITQNPGINSVYKFGDVEGDGIRVYIGSSSMRQNEQPTALAYDPVTMPLEDSIKLFGLRIKPTLANIRQPDNSNFKGKMSGEILTPKGVTFLSGAVGLRYSLHEPGDLKADNFNIQIDRTRPHITTTFLDGLERQLFETSSILRKEKFQINVITTDIDANVQVYINSPQITNNAARDELEHNISIPTNLAHKRLSSHNFGWISGSNYENTSEIMNNPVGTTDAFLLITSGSFKVTGSSMGEFEYVGLSEDVVHKVTGAQIMTRARPDNSDDEYFIRDNATFRHSRDIETGQYSAESSLSHRNYYARKALQLADADHVDHDGASIARLGPGGSFSTHGTPRNLRYVINFLETRSFGYDYNTAQIYRPVDWAFANSWIRKSSIVKFNQYNNLAYTSSVHANRISSLLKYAPLFDDIDDEGEHPYWEDNQLTLLTESEASYGIGGGRLHPVDFVGMNDIVVGKIDTSTDNGYALTTSSVETDDYYNLPDFDAGSAPYVLHAFLLNYNGPYGYPSWKQTRTAEHPVVKYLKNNSITQYEVNAHSQEVLSFVASPYSRKAKQNNIIVREAGHLWHSNYELSMPIYADIYDSASVRFIRPRAPSTLNLEKDYKTSDFNSIMNSKEVVYYDYTETIYPRSQIADTEKSLNRGAYDSLINFDRDDNIRHTMVITNSCERIYTSNAVNARGDNLGHSSWPLETVLFESQSHVAPEGGINDRSGELLHLPQDGAWHILNDAGTDDIYEDRAYAHMRLGAECSPMNRPKFMVFKQSERYPYYTEDESFYKEKLLANGKGLLSEFRVSEFIDEYYDSGSFDSKLSLYGITGSIKGTDLLADFSYTDPVFTVKMPLMKSKNSSKKRMTLSCDALVKFRPYKQFYWPERSLTVGNYLYKDAVKDGVEQASGRSNHNLAMGFLSRLMYNQTLKGMWMPYATKYTASMDGYRNSNTAPQTGPSASANFSRWTPVEALYDASLLPDEVYSMAINSTASFATMPSGIDGGVKIRGYSPKTRHMVENYLSEIQNFYGVQTTSIRGKPGEVINSDGRRSYRIPGTTMFDFGHRKKLVMYIKLSRTEGMNNTTHGAFLSEYPYYQNDAPFDGFGTQTTAFFNSTADTAIAAGEQYNYDFARYGNFITASTRYQADAGILRVKFSPSSDTFTAEEALHGETTEYTYYKHSTSAAFGGYAPSFDLGGGGQANAILHQGMNLKDCIRIDYDSNGAPIISLKGENISAVLNTSGTRVSARDIMTPASFEVEAGGLNTVHPIIGVSSYVTGSVVGSDKGIYLSVEGPTAYQDPTRGAAEDDDRIYEYTIGHDTPTGSLAHVLGLTGRRLVGEPTKKKPIYEGVIMIPIKSETCGETDVYELDESKFYQRLAALQNKGRLRYKYFSDEEIKSIAVKEIQEEDNYIDQIILAQEKYIFPPEFDFLKTIRDNPSANIGDFRNKKLEGLGDSVRPFVAFCFEFSKALSIKDRTDLWQGVLPDFQTDNTKQSISFDIDEVFPQGVNSIVDDELRFMCFKVKQRAETNYEEYKSRELGIDYYSNKRPDISYNWPYDFYSLVQFASIDASISCEMEE